MYDFGGITLFCFFVHSLHIASNDVSKQVFFDLLKWQCILERLAYQDKKI